MKNTHLLSLLLLCASSFSLFAQNTPALWKHTCNCGGMVMMALDDNQNIYVFNDGQNGGSVPTMLKLSPTGAQRFNNSYLPAGYTSMEFNNSIYKNGYLYIAGNVSNSTSSGRLCLTTVDTLGNMVNQLVVDSVRANTISGIKSTPYYSYGFHMDQYNNIHVAFKKYDVNFLPYYSFLKFDINYNLLAYFEDTLTFVSNTGPCFYLPDGTVYYSHTGNLVKLNNSYTSKVWTAPLNSQYAEAGMIQADSIGNLFVLTGQLAGVTDPLFQLNRFKDNGNSYLNNFDSLTAEGPNLSFTQMLVDLANNAVYLAGNNTSNSPIRHYLTKHNATSGAVIWRDSAYDGQIITDLILSAQNNVIAIGGGSDFYVWLYDAQGTVDKTLLYDGPCGANDMIRAARLDSSNKLIVTGTSCENASTINWGTTLKYTIPSITTAAEEIHLVLPLSIFPSPAPTEITLITKIPFRELTAIDMKGKSFSVQLNSNKRIDVSLLPPGQYLLRAHYNKNVYESKFMIVR
jgi:hypothetical protein